MADSDTPVLDPVAPPGPQPVDTSRGNKFREALAKFKVEEKPPVAETPPPPVEPPPPDKPPVETPPTDKKEEEPKPAAETPPPETPKSALEAAIGKDAEPEPPKDDLSEFEKIESPDKENWKRARETMKRQSEEIKNLKTAPKVVDTNVETIQKERDELKERVEKLNTNLKAINAEYSEEYQGLVASRDKVLGKISSRMKYAGEAGKEKADDLVTALNLPEGSMKNRAVKEAIADLEPDDKIAVRALIERLDEADENIAEFRKDLPGQWDKIVAQRDGETREQADKQAKQLEDEFHKVVSDLPKDIVRMRLIPDDVNGAKEWNEPIKEAIEGALVALKPNGTDFRQTISIAVKGKLFDKVWSDYVAQNKELREARARLAEFDGGTPDFKGQKPPPNQVRKTPAQKYHEALAARQGAAVAP